MPFAGRLILLRHVLRELTHEVSLPLFFISRMYSQYWGEPSGVVIFQCSVVICLVDVYVKPNASESFSQCLPRPIVIGNQLCGRNWYIFVWARQNNYITGGQLLTNSFVRYDHVFLLSDAFYGSSPLDFALRMMTALLGIYVKPYATE